MAVASSARAQGLACDYTPLNAWPAPTAGQINQTDETVTIHCSDATYNTTTNSWGGSCVPSPAPYATTFSTDGVTGRLVAFLGASDSQVRNALEAGEFKPWLAAPDGEGLLFVGRAPTELDVPVLGAS